MVRVDMEWTAAPIGWNILLGDRGDGISNLRDSNPHNSIHDICGYSVHGINDMTKEKIPISLSCQGGSKTYPDEKHKPLTCQLFYAKCFLRGASLIILKGSP